MYNPSLADINLIAAGADPKIVLGQEGFEDNVNFSSSAKEHIAALTAKGLTIAQTEEQSDEMNKRYHPEEVRR